MQLGLSSMHVAVVSRDPLMLYERRENFQFTEQIRAKIPSHAEEHYRPFEENHTLGIDRRHRKRLFHAHYQ